MIHMGFSPEQLIGRHGTSYSNIEAYIIGERMRDDGVYGGDLEIATFCHLSGLSVAVYIDTIRQWAIYDSTTQLPKNFVFLMLKHGHFQVIKSLSVPSQVGTSNISVMNEDKQQKTILNHDVALNQAANYQKNILLDEDSEELDYSFPVRNTTFTTSNTVRHLSRFEHEERTNVHSGKFLQQETSDLVLNDESRICRKQSPETGNCSSCHPEVSFLEKTLVSIPGPREERRRCENVDFCIKCLRVPTASFSFPLNRIKDITVKRFVKRRYGCKLNLNEEGNLCSSCATYIDGADGNTFTHAWPSVLCSIFRSPAVPIQTLKAIIESLPLNIVETFMIQRDLFSQTFHEAVKAATFHVLDATEEFFVTREKLASLKGAALKATLDTEAIPRIRCPWGCWEFLEQCELLPFNHVISQIWTPFKAFLSGSKNKFQGTLLDYRKTEKFLNKFVIQPACVVEEEKGLCVLVCSKHCNGSSVQYLHLPQQPILKNVSPIESDNLGAVQQNLRTVKTGRVCFNTHSGHLLHETATFNGLYTSTLTCDSHLNPPSSMQTLSEKLILQNRVDLQIVNNNMLPFETSSSWPHVDLTSYWNAIQFSTSVGLEDAVHAKIKLDEFVKCNTSLESLPPVVIKCNVNDMHGGVPRNIRCDETPVAPILESMAIFWPNFLKNLSECVLDPTTLTGLLGQLILASIASCDEKIKKQISLKVNNYSEDTDWKKTFLQFMTDTSKFEVHSVQEHTTNEININSETEFLYFSAGKRFPKELQNTLTVGDKKFELLLVIENINNKFASFWIRYGSSKQGWWMYNKGSFIKECGCPNHHKADGFLYVEQRCKDTNELSDMYLRHMGGQTVFACSDHKIYLVKNHTTKEKKCSYHKNCKLKSVWICPSFQCSSSVCADVSTEQASKISVPPEEQIVVSSQSSDCDAVSEDDFHNSEKSESDCDDVCYDDYVTNPGSLYFDTDFNDMTDAGVYPDIVSEKSLNSHVPMKILLNNELNILRRKRTPLFCINRHKYFLQSLVSKSPNKSIPVIYPEAMIFPTIFWKQYEDCSYAGALPSCLYSDNKVNKHLGFATLKEHLQNRIMNRSLLTSSSQHYASFAFDCLMNEAMNREHSSTILFRRGWENQLAKDDSVPISGSYLRLDAKEVRLRVRELAAALSEEPATYFLTLTCNMASHFGIAPLFNAISEFYSNAPEHVFKAAVQSNIGLFTRMWHRVVNYLMDYIENSTEQPCGPVRRIWWRVEFQTTRGNLPHIHCLIWTGEEKNSTVVQHRIVCSESQLLWKLREDDKLRKLNLVADNEEAFRIFLEAIRIHHHSCSSNGFRCHKQTDVSKEPICRHPRYEPGYKYFLEEVYVQHIAEVFQILEEIGLAYKDPLRPGNFNVTEELRAGKWHYPNQKSENLSPISAHLFALTRSQMNLLICDKYFQSRYLAKYAAGADDKGRIRASASAQAGVTNIDVLEPQNEKIGGVKRRLRDDNFVGRFISITECYWHILEMKFVHRSFNAINIQTLQMKNRVCLKNATKNLKNVDLRETFIHRETLPEWRRFSANQKLIVQNIPIAYSLDKVSEFSARPPELVFVSSLKTYFTVFHVKKSVCNKGDFMTKINSKKVIHWVDGFGRVILLDNRCLSRVLTEANRSTHISAGKFIELFGCGITETNHHLLHHTEETDNRNVVMFSSFIAEQRERLFVHLMLSLGNFETEIDLFSNSTNMIECLQNAGFDTTNSKLTANIITKRFVLEQAQFIPGSTRTFDRNVLACHKLITEVLTGQQISYLDAPLVLLSAISSEADSKVKQYQTVAKTSLVKSLIDSKKIPNCPTFTEMMTATSDKPFPFIPVLEKEAQQTENCFQQQTNSMNNLLNCIDKMSSDERSFLGNHFVLGRPGTGKSTVCLCALAYAVCSGLEVIVTTLSGENSAKVGGIHLHKLIPFPVDNAQTSNSIAERAIAKLYRSPVQLAYLKSVRVIMIEELGLISAELFTALDLVLQYIHSSFLPMGGVFTFGNGDPQQLTTPSGSLIWFSSTMLTNFFLTYLEEYIRMRDGDGARVLDLINKQDPSDCEVRELLSLIQKPGNCKFIESWKQLRNPETVVKIVPTKKAEKEVVKERLDCLRNSGVVFAESKACDEISPHGLNRWHETTDRNVKFVLNKVTLEQETLNLYKGACMRLTRNFCNGACQGQLCVVREIPNGEVLSLWLAPAGCRNLPPVSKSGERMFESNGWTAFEVKKSFGLIKIFSSTYSIRRKQFPVKSFEASTIHKCIGDDVESIATQISDTSGGYMLWERNQLLVLMSRVRQLSDITFVGNRRDNLLAISNIVRRTTRKDAAIANFVEKVKQGQSSGVVVHDPHHYLYRFNSKTLPEQNGVSLGLFFSLRTKCTLLKQSIDLRKLLHYLNASFEIDEEIKQCRPWALAIAIYGFRSDQMDRIDKIRGTWNSTNEKTENNLFQKLANAEKVCKEFKAENEQLSVAVFFRSSATG